jgi:sugar phosphate isomerase/epimerase
MAMGLGTRGIGARSRSEIPAALARLTEMGYGGIEIGTGTFADADFTPEELKALLDDAGMAVVSVMGSREALRANLESIAAVCGALDCRHVVQAFGPVNSLEQVIEDAGEYAEFGARCRDHGLQFCYHNHDRELFRFFTDKKCALDIYFENIEPDCFAVELDLGWVKFGGQEPAAFLEKYPGRFPLTHLRDVVDLSERGNWAPIGEGSLGIGNIVNAGMRSGVEWFILEQGKIGDLTAEEGVEATARHFRDVGLL